jgi:hypothetical protein
MGSLAHQSVLAISAPRPSRRASGAGAEHRRCASASLCSAGPRGAQPLDGTWQFHLGDDLAWSSPTLDDSRWETIQTGQPWEAQGNYGYTGFAWYRRHVVLAPGEPSDLQLSLLLTGVDNACEVYWNGVLVGSIGKVPPHPVWYVGETGGQETSDEQAPAAFYLGSAMGSARFEVLAIRVWSAPIALIGFPAVGGLVAVPQIGTKEAIAGLERENRYEWLRSNLFTLAEVLLSCVVGLLSLLMWFRNRDGIVLLCLAGVMILPLESLCIVGVPGLLPFRVGYGLLGPSIGLYLASLWYLLVALLGLEAHPQLVRWTRNLAIFFNSIAWLDGALQMFDWSRAPRFFLFCDAVLSSPVFLLELWPLVLALAAVRKRLDAARWALAISAVFAALFQWADDITGMTARWTNWTIGDHLGAPLLTIGSSPLDARAITSTLLLLAILFVAWRYFVEQAQRQNAMAQEYHSAQEIQQVLIPDALPALPGYAVTSANRPAQEVGGDFFQLMPLPGDEALLVLGDVSGKGLGAAMAVALIVGAIRSSVEVTDNPAAILAALNRRLCGRLRSGFATCLVLRLDAHGGCQIANAGHLPPFMNAAEVALPPALPLGLVPHAEYDVLRFQMAEGDRLTLYTDGLLEARNAAGELFGFERIAELLATSPDGPRIASVAQAFGQDDDITVLTIAFTAVSDAGGNDPDRELVTL